MPVPVNVAVCGLFEALSVTVRLAASAPRTVGVYVILMKHLAFGAMLAGQLLVSAKSPAFVPVIVILETLRLVVPVLVSVTLFTALVVLITWLLNASEVAERPAPGLMAPPQKVGKTANPIMVARRIAVFTSSCRNALVCMGDISGMKKVINLQ